jgi:hypothetical protein
MIYNAKGISVWDLLPDTNEEAIVWGGCATENGYMLVENGGGSRIGINVC